MRRCNGTNAIRQAAETSRAVIATPTAATPTIDTPTFVPAAYEHVDEETIDLPEEHERLEDNSDGDEQPLAIIVVNGNLEPEFAHALVMEDGKGQEIQPQVHAVDEDVMEEHEVLVAMSMDEPSDRGVEVVTETSNHLPAIVVDMVEDNDFLTSSQSSEAPLGAPASNDIEMRELQHTSISTTMRNATPSEIPVYDDGNFEEVYVASITTPLRMVEHQFKQLQWNEAPLEVHQPVTDEEVW